MSSLVSTTSSPFISVKLVSLLEALHAWEQRKLGELGTTYGGLTGKSKEDFGHGDARFVPYTNVFDNPIADPTRLGEVEIDMSQNRVLHGDALFTVSSETPEEVGMSSVWLSDLDNLYLNSFCFGYRQDGSFDSYYLAYMLRSKSVREDIELLAQGISRFNISKGKVMEVEVPVPDMEEQRRVGTLFYQLDNLITLHQRKHQSTGHTCVKLGNSVSSRRCSPFYATTRSLAPSLAIPRGKRATFTTETSSSSSVKSSMRGVTSCRESRATRWRAGFHVSPSQTAM